MYFCVKLYRIATNNNDFERKNMFEDYFFVWSQTRGELARSTSVMKMMIEAQETDNEMMKDVCLNLLKEEVAKNEKFLEPVYMNERQKEREALAKEALEHEKRMDEVKL